MERFISIELRRGPILSRGNLMNMSTQAKVRQASWKIQLSRYGIMISNEQYFIVKIVFEIDQY